jgi:hypothetical protein
MVVAYAADNHHENHLHSIDFRRINSQMEKKSGTPGSRFTIVVRIF